MQIPAVLMLCIILVTALIGIVFLFFPGRIGQLEAWLNAPWGNHEVASLRIGLRGEQRLEQALNRDVLGKPVIWDGWLRRHPRTVGALLCLLALWLGFQM